MIMNYGGELFIPGSKPIFDSMLKEALKNNSKTKLDETDNKEITAWAKDFYARLKKIETSENAAMEPATIMAELEKVFPELKESEDERIRKDIMNVVKRAHEFYHPDDIDKWLAWLEKQKEQQPAEWSEEDEKMRKNLIELLIRLSANTRTDSTSPNYSYPREISWLKSLRPQPHWKPSEEQMEWLESAVKLSTDKPHIHGIIISLYEQLKRL